MKCIQCSANVRVKNALFCPYCGAKLPQGEQGTFEDCVAQQTCPKTNDNNRQIDASKREMECKCIDLLREYDCNCRKYDDWVIREVFSVDSEIQKLRSKREDCFFFEGAKKHELSQKILALENQKEQIKKEQQKRSELWAKCQKIGNALDCFEFGRYWRMLWESLYNWNKLVRKQGDLFKDYEFSAELSFGHYLNLDGICEPKYRNIQWQVIASEPNKVLVISSNIVGLQPYDTSDGDEVIWETSALRKWLNDDFYYTAFSDLERSLILNTTVPAENNDFPDVLLGCGNQTQDRIFLLNYEEANKYRLRYYKTSPFSDIKEHGIELPSEYRYSNDWRYWWLRSPQHPYEGVAVLGERESQYVSFRDPKKVLAVRPAMWIDCDVSKIFGNAKH